MTAVELPGTVTEAAPPARSGGLFRTAWGFPQAKIGTGLTLVVVLIALLVQWSRQDERTARRDDRRADADGDADLVAYNAMLRRLATPGAPLVADGDEPGPHPIVARSSGEPADGPQQRPDIPGQSSERGS